MLCWDNKWKLLWSVREAKENEIADVSHLSGCIARAATLGLAGHRASTPVVMLLSSFSPCTGKIPTPPPCNKPRRQEGERNE